MLKEQKKRVKQDIHRKRAEELEAMNRILREMRKSKGRDKGTMRRNCSVNIGYDT
jgi:hypothetical protein